LKWYRPQKLIDEKIQKPIETIGVIAVMALAIALVALFAAIGKGSNNAA
jgi:hypothetical protein